MRNVIEVDAGGFVVSALSESGVWLPIMQFPIDEKLLGQFHYPLLIKVEELALDGTSFSAQETK